MSVMTENARVRVAEVEAEESDDVVLEDIGTVFERVKKAMLNLQNLMSQMEGQVEEVQQERGQRGELTSLDQVTRWRKACRTMIAKSEVSEREVMLAAVAELALDALIAERWWWKNEEETPAPQGAPFTRGGW